MKSNSNELPISVPLSFLFLSFSCSLRRMIIFLTFLCQEKYCKARSPTAFLKIKVPKFDNHSPDEPGT